MSSALTVLIWLLAIGVGMYIIFALLSLILVAFMIFFGD